LQVCSAFGMVAPVDTLVIVHIGVVGGNASELLKCANSLFRKHLLKRQKNHIEFYDDVTRSCIYERMLVSQREAIHMLIADALILDKPKCFAQNYGELIIHLQGSGDLVSKRHYLVLAGLNALHLGSDLEATKLLLQVVELDKEYKGSLWRRSSSFYTKFETEFGSILIKLGFAYYSLGEMTDSIKYITQGLELHDMPVATSKWMRRLKIINFMKRPHLRFKERIQRPGEPNLVDACLAFGTLAQSYIQSGYDSTYFLYAVITAYEISSSVNDSNGKSMACSWLTIATTSAGMRTLGSRFATRLADLGDLGSGDVVVTSYATYGSMFNNGSLGLLGEAFRNAEKAATSCGAMGEVRRTKEVHIMLLLLHKELGDMVTYHKKMKALLDQALDSADTDVGAKLMSVEGERCIFAQGKLQRGMELLGEANTINNALVGGDDDAFARSLGLSLEGRYNEALTVGIRCLKQTKHANLFWFRYPNLLIGVIAAKGLHDQAVLSGVRGSNFKDITKFMDQLVKLLKKYSKMMDVFLPIYSFARGIQKLALKKKKTNWQRDIEPLFRNAWDKTEILRLKAFAMYHCILGKYGFGMVGELGGGGVVFPPRDREATVSVAPIIQNKTSTTNSNSNGFHGAMNRRSSQSVQIPSFLLQGQDLVMMKVAMETFEKLGMTDYSRVDYADVVVGEGKIIRVNWIDERSLSIASSMSGRGTSERLL
jgi:tetratricopeptide (TPR) repeat protein